MRNILNFTKVELFFNKIILSILLMSSTLVFAQPSNDNPCNAIEITPTVDCNYTIYSNVNATASANVVSPGCASYIGGDVWFSIVVPQSGLLTIDTQAGAMTNSGMALYYGECNNLILMTCDPNSGSGLMSKISQSGLSSGDSLWVRVWGENNQTGDFGICVTSPPNCGANAIAGDECSTAPPICNLNGYCGNTSSNYTSSGKTWSDLKTTFCGASIDNDSYVSFVASSSTISLYVWVLNSLDNHGVQMMIFSTNTCGSGTPNKVYCNSGFGPSNDPEIVSVSGLTIGAKYYLMVDGVAGDVCDYIIGVPSQGSGLDIPVSVSPVSATICAGNSISITATGGDGNYDWTTSPNVATLNTTNTATVTSQALSVGTYVYNATSTSLSNCPSNSTSTINVVASPGQTTGLNAICPGTKTQLTNATIGGVWSSLDVSKAIVNSKGVVTGVADGSCTIRYTVCGVDVDFPITINSSLGIGSISGLSDVCIGSNITLTNPTNGGVWTSADPTKATVNSSGVVTGVTVGSTIIKYVSGALNGCNQAKKTITINSLPVVNPITGTLQSCKGVDATLIGSPLNGSWSSGSLNVATIDPTSGVVKPITKGVAVITYTYTDNNNCQNKITENFTTLQPDPQIYDLTNSDHVYCLFHLEDTLKMSSNIGATKGKWSFISPSSGGQATFLPDSIFNTGIKVDKYGDYKFVFAEETCKNTDTILVKFRPGAYALIDSIFTICKGVNQDLKPFYSYPEYITSLVWSTGAITPSISVNEENKYTLTVSTGCGNPYVTSSKLIVKVCEIQSMPNVITPNGDGINDVYVIDVEQGIFKTFDIVITNRWGNLIKEYNDPVKGAWDGKNQVGDFVDEGVYFYSVKAETLAGEKITKQGFIHVIYE